MGGRESTAPSHLTGYSSLVSSHPLYFHGFQLLPLTCHELTQPFLLPVSTITSAIITYLYISVQRPGYPSNLFITTPFWGHTFLFCQSMYLSLHSMTSPLPFSLQQPSSPSLLLCITIPSLFLSAHRVFISDLCKSSSIISLVFSSSLLPT